MKKFLTFVTCLSVLYSYSQQSSSLQAAGNFLKSLNSEQKNKTLYSFTSEERYNWHFFPKDDRKGIALNELNEQQKQLAYALMKSGLSENGFNKVMDVIQLESVLKALENRKEDDHYRDPGKYYLIIFGTSSLNDIWGWRLEGHHVSFSFSVSDNKIVSGTPAFLGANPGIVPSGLKKGKQVLKEESEKAFSLLNSFTNEQLQRAIFSKDAPREIITFVSRKAMIDNPQGITYAQMNKDQQHQFLELIHVYIHRYTKLFADDMMKEIHEAGLDKLYFAWAGTQHANSGRGYYYRIQGPTLLIEFDNTQNNANHIHTVVRDLKRDFGGDELLEHYKKEH